MKKHLGWSITARLVTLALVPAAVMLIAVNASLYMTAAEEANADIQERGRLIAATLAEGSRYGVISGNVNSLQDTVDALMATDPSIITIQVFDADRSPLVVTRSARSAGVLNRFDAAIEAGVLDVNLFDSVSSDDASAASGSPDSDARAPVGHVQVVMSPEPILDAKRGRLYFSSAMVLMAALVSSLIGLGLARRLRGPLNAVMTALREIRRGQFEVRLERRAAGELGELQSAIVEMARGLKVTHQQLENQVAARTQELEAAVAIANAANAEKRRLIARGNELVEDERRRIALELHDDINALLVSIRLHAAALASQADKTNSADMHTSAERLSNLVDEAYRRAREIVQNLRPEIIDTLGLAGAIEEMIRHLNETGTSCRFGFSADPELPKLPEPMAIAAYRVVQETLSNVVKHANASKCSVVLSRQAGDAEIKVSIDDDGQGFDLEASMTTGLGLVGMRERVSVLQGTLVVDSAVGKGTSVTMIMPLDPTVGHDVGPA